MGSKIDNKIINCKNLSLQLQDKLAKEVLQLKLLGIQPNFATVMIGEDPASMLYVGNKQRKAKELGISNIDYNLPVTTKESDLLKLIDTLNADSNVHGILVQLPLPVEINSLKIIGRISPKKDIDGLHPINIGHLSTNSSQGFIPCTALGCMYILNSVEKNLIGKHAVIIGRSHLVGLPLSQLLMNNDATVTVCHSKTVNLASICKTADIVISAVGKAHLVNSEHIKNGSIVIDVGISKIEINNKSRIVGDVDLDSVLPLVKYITPVPSGVGILTVTCLMSNIIKATKNLSAYDNF